MGPKGMVRSKGKRNRKWGRHDRAAARRRGQHVMANDSKLASSRVWSSALSCYISSESVLAKRLPRAAEPIR